MWNFERKWAKIYFLICWALWGNGVVWVCLQGGGDADWVSCWLSWLTMWLNQWIVGIFDRVGWFGWWLCVFSLGLGVQWVGWLYFDLMVRWLRHWMVGNGVESECVRGAGWVLVWSVDCVCVCVWGGVVGCWQNWMILMMTWYVFTGAGCAMGWMTVYFDSGGRWLGHWMVGNGGESVCVCGAGWVLVRSVDRVCV